MQDERARQTKKVLTERLIHGVKNLLDELLILDELAYTSKTLGHLQRRETAHQVVD